MLLLQKMDQIALLFQTLHTKYQVSNEALKKKVEDRIILLLQKKGLNCPTLPDTKYQYHKFRMKLPIKTCVHLNASYVQFMFVDLTTKIGKKILTPPKFLSKSATCNYFYRTFWHTFRKRLNIIVLKNMSYKIKLKRYSYEKKVDYPEEKKGAKIGSYKYQTSPTINTSCCAQRYFYNWNNKFIAPSLNKSTTITNK
eukprot:TRINITY_DN77518_c0_g1_i1.p1 TRINITY_DN77518_c0_g1~~TRINITY_DN77518_c0_g1_i1.p1  ORF type:complete len:197 (+),score=1.87 TRINITY_DN77518_c0_g1_i1:363-953(+)